MTTGNTFPSIANFFPQFLHLSLLAPEIVPKGVPHHNVKSWKSRKCFFSDRNKDGCRYRRPCVALIKLSAEPWDLRLVGLLFTNTDRVHPCPIDFSLPLQRHYSGNSFAFLSFSQSDFRLVGSVFTKTDRSHPCLIDSIRRHFLPSA